MKAFVSCSAADAGFVRLLIRLLEFHGIDPWYSTVNPTGEDHFAYALGHIPPDIDAMIAVVSGESANSGWVFNEIRTFRRLHPDSIIALLAIDDAGAAASLELDVEGIRRVGFHECLLHGFESLFSIFGRKFLETRQSRARSAGDRRRSSVRQRLRFAIWKEYHSATGTGEMESVDAAYSKMMQLIDACTKAMRSFTLTSKADGRAADPAEPLEQIVREVWVGLGHSPQRAVLLTEAVAELIWERFNVLAVDRRSGDRAAKAAGSGK